MLYSTDNSSEKNFSQTLEKKIFFDLDVLKSELDIYIYIYIYIYGEMRHLFFSFFYCFSPTFRQIGVTPFKNFQKFLKISKILKNFKEF